MESNRIIRRADPTSIQNKVLVGYQGWFTCAGDGPPVHQGHHGWLHWFDKPLPEGGRPNFDLYPDTTEYDQDELYPAPGLSAATSYSGQRQPAMLFSSRNPKTVQRHFNWMAKHGIDGAFLQRFATQCEADGNTTGATADLMRLRDEVLDRVREAAEKENRVWAIMYDVAGLPADRVEHVLRVDWEHLMRDKRILDSPYYLRERGHPVVAIWGLGFVEARHDPQMVASIVRHIKSITPGGAYVWGGVPSQWRTLSGDMDPNPAFLDVFKNEFDALSPWTVGRYHDRDSMDRFCEDRTRGDINELKDLPRRVDFFPTIWPGGSSYNLSSGRLGLNDAPREGGKFFWRQLWNVKHMGARSIYVAMFDEYDEGTAILPAVPLKRSLPTCDDPNRQFPFIALDADGIDNLTPDWYLKICGFAAEAMRDERRVYEDLPRKELDDYWATRPKYESIEQGYASHSGRSGSTASGVGGSGTSNSNAAPAAEEKKPPVRSDTWGAFGADFSEAPPAYSLEASEEPAPISEEPAGINAATLATAALITQPVSSTATSPLVSSSQSPNEPISSSPGGPHRSSSYTAPSQQQQTISQGATGLGRASTYSPPSSTPGNNQPPVVAVTQSTPSPSVNPGPRWAPPTVPPPLRPYNVYQRPPVHPSSPSVGQSTPSSQSQGASTPPQNYAPYRHPSAGPATPSSTSSLPQDFSHSMNLGGSGSGTNTPPMVYPAHLGNVPGGASPGHQNSLMQPIGSSGSSTYSYPMASGNLLGNLASGAGLPGPSNSGYFNQPTTTSYGGGTSNTTAPASRPQWGPPSVPPPGPRPPSTPATNPGVWSVPPSTVNSNVPPHLQYPPGVPSSSPGGPVIPGQSPQWTAPFPAASSGSNSPYPSPGVGPNQGPSQGPSQGAGTPALPPRPSGEAGSSTSPQNTLIGGLANKASGLVGKYAGENTRVQLEKSVSSVTQTGSKLLGRFTGNKLS